MKSFYVTVKVRNTEYLTKVSAETAIMAEHMIIDSGICGKHEYGCESCIAYDADMMKTETFTACAMAAEPISMCELIRKIEENNNRIKAKDAAEEEYINQQKRVEEIKKRLEEAEKALIAARRAFAET